MNVSDRYDGILIELRCDTWNMVFSEKVLPRSSFSLEHASNPLLNCLAINFIVRQGPSTSSSSSPESSEAVWTKFDWLKGEAVSSFLILHFCTSEVF